MKKLSLLALILILMLCLPVLVACSQKSESLHFTSNGDGTCYVTAYNNNTFAETHLVIPPKSPKGDIVTGIGDPSSGRDGYAFLSCESLVSVSIPDTVKTICSEAFRDCINLKSLVFAENSQLASIGDCAFTGCTNLSNISIPSGVKSIGKAAFSSCTNLISITIPDTVTSIGEIAFNECYKLMEVYNLSSVEIQPAQYAYESIKNVYTNIDVPSKLTTKDEYIFYCDDNTSEYYLMGYTGSDTELTLPDDINGKSYEIFRYAFSYSEIIKVTIPDGIASISENAFTDCISLKSIEIPNSVTSIDAYAFSNCTSLENIIIPDGVTEIGLGAFSNCTSLKSITIPSSVTSIGYWMFSDGTSITTVNYTGTEEQWNSISAKDNDFFADVTINFNYVP